MNLIDDNKSTTKRGGKVKPPAIKPSVNPKQRIYKATGTNLTRKQELFVKKIVENPKQSATTIAQEVYDVKEYSTAGAIATENLKKPQVISRLAEHNSMIESVLTNTVAEYGYSDKIQERSLAVDTSKWLHDKIHGKAVQKSSSVNMNFTQHVTGQKYDI